MTPLNGLCPPTDDVIKLDYNEFMTDSEEKYFDSYDQAVQKQAPLMESKELPQAFNVKVVESALDTQVGGDHYKKLVIQPGVFSERNKLSHFESDIVKRICRYKDKNGGRDAIMDLEKIKHDVDILIELHNEDKQ